MYPLKQVIEDASQALATLDTGRLEELAAACRGLNRGLQTASADSLTQFAQEAEEARPDLAILSRIVDATRENLRVLHRAQERRRSGHSSGYLQNSAV